MSARKRLIRRRGNTSEDKGDLKRENITIDNIRSTFPEEKRTVERNNLFGHFVLRRISYYLTWLFIRLGISANEVTGISILIGCFGCILLAFGSYSGMIVGALILNIWALLEFVDGNVARATNSSSNYGAFIDALNASTMGILLFVSAGIAAFSYPDPHLNSFIRYFLAISIDKGVFLFFGCWASLFYIFPRFIGDAFVKAFSQEQRAFVDELKRDISMSIASKIRFNIYNITGLIMPILLIAVIFNFLGFFVLFFALINTCAFIVLISQLLRKARASNG